MSRTFETVEIVGKVAIHRNNKGEIFFIEVLD